MTNYFSHDSNARNSDKLIPLRASMGVEGYGIYFMLLERLREEPDYMSVKDYNMLAFDFRVDAAKVKSVVENFGLFAFTDDGKCFYSEGFTRRMSVKDNKSEKARLSALSRWDKCERNANAMRTHEKVDAIKVKKSKENNNSLSLSLSPLESRESESGEDIGGVSAADRESFFEILFFRNFKNPEKETDRLIDHYSAVGWRRHGDIRAVRDKTALARNWKPQSENDLGRFQPDILAKLQSVYAEIKAESPEDASTIIRGTYGFDEMPDLFRIKCINKATADAYERHCAIIKATNLTNGKRLSYGVLKK